MFHEADRPTRRCDHRKAPAFLRALVALLAAPVLGCDRGASDGTNASTGPARPLAVVVSADTAGWITPCGCASNQSGGMLRRATMVAQVGAGGADVAYADAGGAAGGDSDYHRVKFEAILAGERRMGVIAHNVGRSEAALGADYLRDVAGRVGAPLVSANVRDASGKPVAEPLRIATAGGRRVAFVGVLAPRFAPPNGTLRVTDPKQAVLATAAAAKGKYDALVVLAYLPQDELEQLAAALPEADAVVGGPTGQAVAPRAVGPTLLASSTNKGKFLVELRPPAAPAQGPWGGRVVEVASTFAEDAGQADGLKAYLSELERRDFPASKTGLVAPLPPGTPAGYAVAGSQACAKCHEPDQSVWHNSKHAHAWETIRAKGMHVDSACQQCHTTGFGLPGGFESRATSAAARVDVGCENCHGPSLAHAQRPEVRTPFAALDQCARCHDHENSPSFDFNAYWPRIFHGPAKPKPPDTGASAAAPAAAGSSAANAAAAADRDDPS